MYEARLLNCEQYSRNKNIEMKGVPVQASDNIPGLLRKIGETVVEITSPADIEIWHCVPEPNNPTNKNIVLQIFYWGK